VIDVLFGHMGYPTKSRIDISFLTIILGLSIFHWLEKLIKLKLAAQVSEHLVVFVGLKCGRKDSLVVCFMKLLYLASDLLTSSSAAARKENIGIWNVINVHFYRFSS